MAVGLAIEDNSRTVGGHLYLGPALHGDLQVQEEAERNGMVLIVRM